MTFRRRLAGLLAFSLAGPGVAPAHSAGMAQGAGQPPLIQHTPLLCMEPTSFPALDARVTAAAPIQRTRVYFKAHQFPDWYYVEMKATEAANYVALLPQPLPGTTLIDYYLYALDAQFQTGQTDQYLPVVSKGKCTIKGGAKPAVANPQIILGGTKEGQPSIPPGFSKAGIIAFVTIAGATIAGSALAGGGGAAAVAAGGAGAAATGGVSAVTVAAVVGGAALVAGGAIAVAGRGSNSSSPTFTTTTTTSTTTTSTTTTTPAPTTTTTTVPTGVNLTGSWAGTAPDGVVITGNPDCVLELDLFLNLTQSGSTVSGSGMVVKRKLNPNPPPSHMCSEKLGEQQQLTITGTAAGGNFTGTIMVMTVESTVVTLTGMYTATRMSGTFTSTDSPPQSGTWAVNKQ